jgi:hypothetical protein
MCGREEERREAHKMKYVQTTVHIWEIYFSQLLLAKLFQSAINEFPKLKTSHIDVYVWAFVYKKRQFVSSFER